LNVGVIYTFNNASELFAATVEGAEVSKQLACWVY
jgi:hypothetical protein